MRRPFLQDTVTGKNYNLTALAEANNDRISIGRIGRGNLIELGEEVPETTSGRNAIVECECIAAYRTFYIRADPDNLVRLNEEYLNEQRYILTDGDRVRFGATAARARLKYREVWD